MRYSDGDPPDGVPQVQDAFHDDLLGGTRRSWWGPYDDHGLTVCVGLHPGGLAAYQHVRSAGIDGIAEDVLGTKKNAQGGARGAPKVRGLGFERQTGGGRWHQRNPCRHPRGALALELSLQAQALLA